MLCNYIAFGQATCYLTQNKNLNFYFHLCYSVDYLIQVRNELNHTIQEADLDTTVKKDSPFIEITGELCKGCKLCIDVCPKGVIAISEQLNSSSYHPAFYVGADCTGCTLCFYACPEPAAIKVFKP